MEKTSDIDVSCESKGTKKLMYINSIFLKFKGLK